MRPINDYASQIVLQMGHSASIMTMTMDSTSQDNWERYECIKPFQLFNMLNNSQPITILDCRSNDDYEQRHLQRSCNIESIFALEPSLKKLLTPNEAATNSPTMLFLVLLLPTELQSDVALSMDSILQQTIKDNGAVFVDSVSEGTHVEDASVLLTRSQVSTEAAVAPLQTESTVDSTVVEAPPPSTESNETSTTITTVSTDNVIDTLPAIASSRVLTTSPMRVKVYVLPNAEEFFSVYSTCSTLFSQGSALQRNSYYASEIIPRFLYLGDYVNATSVQQLKELNITHVVDATGHRTAEATALALQLQYLPIDVDDIETADLASHFPNTNAFIHAARFPAAQSTPPAPTAESSAVDSSPIHSDNLPSRVLVHCRAGWSRSPSIVLAYLLQHENQSLLEAARRLVSQRPMICPNEGFMNQLIEFEKESYQGDQEGRCQSAAQLRLEILKGSCMWTSSLTVETAFDRVPIRAFQQQQQQLLPLQEHPVDGEVVVTKPKKPFLKRGEGKSIIPKRPANSQKKSTSRYQPLSEPSAIQSDIATVALGTEVSGNTSDSVVMPAVLLKSESLSVLETEKSGL